MAYRKVETPLLLNVDIAAKRAMEDDDTIKKFIDKHGLRLSNEIHGAEHAENLTVGLLECVDSYNNTDFNETLLSKQGIKRSSTMDFVETDCADNGQCSTTKKHTVVGVNCQG